ncbi:hypothetical protein LVJ94_51520 [Pendulispora rubella]|uniref:Uncharacterized protein n=1 Tax=Pendulispora rubella TaxID=2741070 RepID=A0ABZ2L302_9BACT
MHVLKAVVATSLLALSITGCADTDSADVDPANVEPAGLEPAAIDATFRLTPASTNFTASGSMTLKKGLVTLNCTATFTGATDAAGAGKVTAATFSGGSLCSGLKSAGFPWAVVPSSTTQATVQNVTVNTSLGACGPSNLAAAYNNTNGSLTFTNAALSGGCSVSGTLTTSPRITVVAQ